MHDELTANDIKKMEDEIEYRKLVVRKKALDDVKVARAQGDLSENFEYKAAKQFKNQNESRIRYLEKMIKTAVVISDESKDDEVGMFNTVDVNLIWKRFWIIRMRHFLLKKTKQVLIWYTVRVLTEC